MIAVTGAPRTGTSLVMQTLGHLGIELTGDGYRPEFGPKEFFPNGAWDLSVEELNHGINTDKYKGKAVKLYAGPLFETDSKYISKLIVCKRIKSDAVESSFKLMKVTPALEGIPQEKIYAERLYDVSYRMIDHYLRDNEVDFIDINFEDMLRHTVLAVDKIKNFIGSKKSIQQAIININTGNEV